MSNIKEVAKLAGVSISTVSRVMNGSKNVSPELEERVRTVAAEVGYNANRAAQSLRRGQSRRVGVILTSISRTFFTAVLEGINKIADDYGYTIILMETHDSLTKEIELVKNCVDQWVDGIILCSSAYGKDQYTKNYIASLCNLQKRGHWIPVITLEYQFDDVNLDAIVIDSEKAAYQAVSYMIHTVGKREIIHISLPSDHILGQKRLAGYRRALTEAGLPVRKRNIIQGDYTTFCGYTNVKLLLQTGRKFDGIFCANDQMAVGAILACNECGVSIPEDVAVVGNDDIFAASLVRPSLSSIKVPRYELGLTAMMRLNEMMEEGRPNQRRIITLETEFVERGSTVRGYQEDLKNLVW
ncbi:MAG: LacI family transcriptional regulator [Clostridiales bacterium]|nr:LacI family transcriptional regulator [Clostridiales bacterium]MCD8352946.1 LacI family transcriptional regulator [Clostridiales bacterium]